jgi:hypothetical protein
MLSKSNTLRLAVVFVTLVLAALSSGCEQARRDIAAALSPATAQDVLKNVRQKIADGNFKAAREEGEAFLEASSDDTGLLAWELSKACAQLGDNDRAIHFVEKAIRAHAVSGIDLMSEPMLEPLRTDPRLVALAAGLAPASAAASLGANGGEASAGNGSVKLPD